MRKLIAKIIFRPRKGVKNYICKVKSGDTNFIEVRSLFLEDENVAPLEIDKLIYSKFGKYLFLRKSVFSIETLNAMQQVANKNFAELENGYYVGRIL